MIKSLRFLLLIIPFTLFSCEKKFLEVIPVLQLQEDISIADGGNIKYFSFPTTSVGYASSDTTFFYKTIDGGKTWTKANFPGSAGKCAGLDFFDALHGIALIGNAVYSTENGGQSWIYKQQGNFIGISEGQKGIIGRWDVRQPFSPGPENFCTIFVSNDKGKSFQQNGKIQIASDFVTGKVTGQQVFAIGKDAAFNDSFYGLDLVTGQEILQPIKLIHDDKPEDIFINEYTGAIVGNKGNITPIDNSNRAYFGHTYTYNSIDGYNDFMVAVGEKTITSNLDLLNGETWNEIIGQDGKSFKQTFYKIKFINQDEFYLSGNNGLLWKAKL